MARPIMLGIVGDSASGKTTLSKGLVQLLGEDVRHRDLHRRLPQVRPPPARRARHHAAEPGVQLPRHHGPAPAVPAPGRGDPQARLPAPRRHVRPARLPRARTASWSSRDCSATTPRTCARPTTCASTSTRRSRCGASGRSTATAPSAATRPTRCSPTSTAASPTPRRSSARSAATPTSSSAAWRAPTDPFILDAELTLRDGLPHPDLSPFVDESDGQITLEERDGESELFIPGALPRERAAAIEEVDLGPHALRPPPALREARRVHRRQPRAPLGVARARAAADRLPPDDGAGARRARRAGARADEAARPS